MVSLRERKFSEVILDSDSLLVIAAPRPSGLPDLDSIQAGLSGGRFFVRHHDLYCDSMATAAHFQ